MNNKASKYKYIVLGLSILGLVLTLYVCRNGIAEALIHTEFVENYIWQRVNSDVQRHAFNGLLQRYEKYETKHFEIYYHKDESIEYIKNIADEAESIYKPVCLMFGGGVVKNKTPIVIIPQDEENYSSEFTGIIRFSKQQISQGYTVKQVISHEFTHVITRELTHDHCPGWLDEGIAVYTEVVASGQVRFKEPTCKYTIYELDLNERKIPSEYEESYLIIKFISEKYGFNSIIKILDVVKDGRASTQAAFIKVLHMNYDELYSAIQKV